MFMISKEDFKTKYTHDIILLGCDNMVNFFEEGITIKSFDGTDIPKMKIINGSVYKIIETDKSSVGKSGIPYMEPLVMEYTRRMGLPVPEVTDLLYQNNCYIFATKLLDGYENAKEVIKRHPELEEELIRITNELRENYELCGLKRQMDLKDMLIKIQNNQIIDIVPVDFERLKYNDNLDWDVIYQICSEWDITLPEQYTNHGKAL